MVLNLSIKQRILGLFLLNAAVFLAIYWVANQKIAALYESGMTQMVKEMTYMSTVGAVDALRKGNMETFAHILKEVAKDKDIHEFSLLSPEGKVLYSSKEENLGKVYTPSQLASLESKYFVKVIPVKTTAYCTVCHPGWKEGEINSKFLLSYDKGTLYAARSLKEKGLFVAVLVFVVTFVISSLVFIFSVDRPLLRFRKGVEAISSGNLSHRFHEKGQDEISQMGRYLNRLVKDLANLLKNMTSSGQEVALRTQEVVDKTAFIVETAAIQEEKALKAKEMAKDIGQVVNTSQEVEGAVSRVVETVEQGKEVIHRVEKGISNLSGAVENVSQNLEKLAGFSGEISRILAMIQDITDKTNLLALNATIEAVRAGEAGKGFVVVANEVKELARNTRKATEEIDKILSSISGEVDTAVSTMEESVKEAETGRKLASEIEEFFYRLAEEVRFIDEAVRRMGELSREVGSFAQKDLDEIYVAAQENKKVVASLEEIAASLEVAVARLSQLVKESEKLRG
ncbi:methyl-accepting chemotaxis protein [Thermodesulfatator atlanticus]|uniref:methyl-accepting chemotaxis protein n=1 Tax=Thermodesulfatator atlanticus TaxID=501497 RepID=UPI0003B7194E|nr:methyl-accepting chemotaxis protein [Thermodesulfatator atlanticus]